MNDKMKNIKSILGELVTEEKGLVNANKLRDKLELDHKEKKEKNYKEKQNSFQKDLIKTEKKQATKRKFEKNSKLEQLDMFSAVIVDASVKDDAATMSVPFFSLSKVKDDVPRTYQDENGDDILKLEPSGRGLATIWDKDILLFCMSQIMSAINKKQKISQTLKIDTYSVLTATNRGCGRGSYENIEDALIRLRGTTIMTSISTGDKKITKGFGFIENFEIESIGKERELTRKDAKGNEVTIKKRTVLNFTVKLSDWIFNALKAEEVLTLDNNYFELSGGIERRLYEICRKHLGKQRHWEIKIENLFKKSGVKNSDLTPNNPSEKKKYGNSLKKFRLEIKNIAEENSLKEVGYKVIFDKESDKIKVKPINEPVETEE